MPQSPPKRVTRARAKKDVNSKPDTTRIMTPSAKVSAQKKVADQSTKPLKDKVLVATDREADYEPNIMPEQPEEEVPKARGKSRASTEVTVESKSKPSTAPAKSTRSRSAKTTLTSGNEAEAPKPRGRSKKTAGMEGPVETIENATVSEPPVKATRSRAAAINPNPPSTRARAAAAAPKKKVKFETHSEQDKENLPVVTDAKATGLRAKPIRKPAVPKAGAKATKATKQNSKAENDAPKQDAVPLSPKKVTQVAKTPSIGSEDELTGDKTPLKILSGSPSKIPMSVSREANPVSADSELTKGDTPQSPQRDVSPGRLATSPRKPPPSPFKDALKSSPRKIDLGSRPAQPKFDVPSSPSKSPLKESPKRVNLTESTLQPILQWSKTPLKSSLLQSPARRPGGSVMKTPSTLFSSKMTTGAPHFEPRTDSAKVNASKLSSVVTESAASSPLRAAKSPGQHPIFHSPIKQTEKKSDVQEARRSTYRTMELDIETSNTTSKSQGGEVSPQQEGKHEQIDETSMLEHSEAQGLREGDLDTQDLEEHSFSHSLEKFRDTVDECDMTDYQQADTAISGIETVVRSMEVPERSIKPAFVLSSPMFTGKMDESESEDELASPQKAGLQSPRKSLGISTKDFATPSIANAQQGHGSLTAVTQSTARREKRSSVAMTPLALQLSSWLASSPEKKVNDQSRHKRGVFSPAKPVFPVQMGQSPTRSAVGSPIKTSFFEDEMAVRNVEDVPRIQEEHSTVDFQENQDKNYLDFQASQESHESETYGDENAVPDVSNVFFENEEQDHTLTCTPARVFQQQSREIHTVSKVPLRPAADDTPLIVSRKRSRSVTGPLSVISMPDRQSISRDSILSPILQDRNLSMSMLPGLPESPKTPTTGPISNSNTPGRSIRKAGYSNVLKGAVVHVDVHTTEGADASGIFVDLLTQMGARCVKQWHWNPLGSLSNSSGASPPQSASPDAETPSSKIGITHIVYKDGGKRTLEKVREAKGAVLCVGVGWVLEYVLNPCSF